MQPIEWRPIEGYEGYYEISERGDVRSLDREITNRGRLRRIPGVSRKAFPDTFGHMRIGLCKDGVGKTHKVHRLVARAFLGAPPSELHEVCHNDGNPKNNDWRNLRWGTRQENTDDRDKHGRTWKGSKPKLNPQQDRELTRWYLNGESIATLAQRYGVGEIAARNAVVRVAGTRAKFRDRSSCKNGHDWVQENLRTNSSGILFCVLCSREASRRSHLRKKERKHGASIVAHTATGL